MADKKISELPASGALTGDELVPVVQGGTTMRTTVAAVAPVRTTADAIVAVGSVSANYAIALDAARVYTLTLADDVTLSATGMSATESRAVQVRVTASGARTLSFPAAWKWDGQKPASMLAGAQGVLSLTSFGATEADVVASWRDLGSGS